MMHLPRARSVPLSLRGALVAALLGAAWGQAGELPAQLASHGPLVAPPLVPLLTRNPVLPRGALGNSVAMDLDVAVVGAPGGRDAPGAAYVFTRALTGEWREEAQLAGHAAGDEFGSSVAVAGGHALVGAGAADPAAYVFAHEGATWTPEARLPVGRGTMSVALSATGERAVVGVAGGADPGVEAAYVFAREADGTWSREAVLAPLPGTPAGSGFGWSVAMDDALVAVGAQGENGANGAVHVFQRTPQGRWQRQSHLALRTDRPPALFGWSVALSGGTLMVGAFGENSFKGAAYLFQQGEAGTWTQLARLVPDSPASAYQCFGFSVGLTLYGALIGQPCDGEGGRQVTRAYLFSRDPGGTWSRRTAVTSPRAPSTANFGAALATNGLDVVIGSPSEAPSGAAYVIECLPCLLYGGQR